MEDRYYSSGIILFSFHHQKSIIVLKYYSLQNIPESQILRKISSVNKEYEIAKLFRNNTHIVQVLRHDKIRYDNELIGIIMYMEYFPNTLKHIFDKRNKFSNDEVIDFLHQMNSAISSLHLNRPPIFHFDIKPSNIGVKSISGKQIYVLMDFDVSLKTENENIGHYDITSGLTPAYAAPELISKYLHNTGQINSKVDIYAIGAIAMRMHTGVSPKKNGNYKYILPFELCEDNWRNLFMQLCHPDQNKRTKSIDVVLK